MGWHPVDRKLLTKSRHRPLDTDRRGLSITMELQLAEFFELACGRSIAIRNAVYAVVGATGEPMGLRRGRLQLRRSRSGSPPWFEYEAKRQ